MHAKSYELALAWDVSPYTCDKCGRTPYTGLKWKTQQVEASRNRPLDNVIFECLKCGHRQLWKRNGLLARIRRLQRIRRRPTETHVA